MSQPTATPRRGRGAGRPYQTVDGRWRAAVTLPDPSRPSGKVRRYLSGRTEAEVGAALAAARAAGQLPERRVPRAPTVEAYATRWLKLHRQHVRPSTWRAYRAVVHDHLLPVLGRRRLDELNPSDIEAMTAWLLARGRAPGTAARARRVAVVMLNAALRDGLVMRNVAQLARPPAGSRSTRARALSVVDLRRLLHAVRDDRLGPLVALAVVTGLRRAELVALRWSDVEPDGNTLTVRLAATEAGVDGARHWQMGEPKTRRSRRTVALPAVARAALVTARERIDADRAAADGYYRDQDYLFPDPDGRMQNPDALSRAWREFADRSGFAGIRLHDLRHTAATVLLVAGLPVRDVADALGHASPSITLDVYGHAVAGGSARVAATIDTVLGDGT